MEHRLLQKVEASTTVHLPLDQLEAVDLTFDWAVAPGLGDRRPYGVQILAQAGGEAAQSRCCRRVEPGFQPCRIIPPQQTGEGSHVAGRDPNLWGGLTQRVDERPLLVGQLGRIARQQARGPARRGRVTQSRAIRCGLSPLSDPAANDIDTATEAPRPQFPVQVGAAAEPRLPAGFGKAAMPVEQARSRRSSIRNERTGAQVAAHSVASQPGPVRDLQDW